MMKRFVGLDVSQAKTAICVVDADGKTLAEGVTATEPGAIAAFLRRRAPDPERVGLETGPLSVWLWNELHALGVPVICMDARHANSGLKVMAAKTDRNDAAGIAQLVRTGWFRRVHMKAEASHVVRATLATRTLLVRMRCDLENQIRGVLKIFGLVIGKAPSRLARRAAEIADDELAAKPELASLVRTLLAMRSAVLEHIGELDADLRARAKTSLVCRRFMTVPGVGPITALAVSAGIDDQQRFARSRNVGAYFGLTPRRYASGEVNRSGRITKRGDPAVRTLLYEAANVLLVKISRPSVLRSWGLAIAQRSGFKKAKIAVARKFAVLLHRMWRDGTEFRWSDEPAVI
jgi:transposase